MNKVVGHSSILLIATLLSSLVSQQVIAGSVRIYNNDSSTHRIELKCSGSSKTVEVNSSSTSTYTFHSTNESCDIVGGSISFPTDKLRNGQAWKIKQGSAKKN
jgi:hypothetical protein